MGGRSGAWSLPVIVALGLALAGCASSGPHFAGSHHAHKERGQPVYRVEPYQVKGVWYTPRADYGYDETGLASWYGPGFDQQLTADNEIYDMNELSAAHKTLPLPSVVQVTNLQNGRTVRVRIMKEESIEVAEAAMRGGTGRVLLAQAAATEPAPAPRSESRPPMQVAAAGPPSLRAAEVIGTPPPAAAPPEPPPAARPAAAPAPSGYWP